MIRRLQIERSHRHGVPFRASSPRTFGLRRIRRGRSTSGMTLIEVLIVTALLALVATGIGFGIGALHRTKLRSSALDVVGAARFAYHRAVTRGNTVRIALDMDTHTISVEEALGTVMLDRSESFGDEEEGEAIDPWAAARARLEDAYGANLGRASFGPILGSNGEPLRRFTPHQFPVANSTSVSGDDDEDPSEIARGANVHIIQLMTPHEREPRQSGKGYIYFFPGGRSEHSVVQIADDDREAVYSIEIHPLTGRGRVYSYAYEPEEMLDDESEVRDPG